MLFMRDVHANACSHIIQDTVLETVPFNVRWLKGSVENTVFIQMEWILD